MLILPKVLLLSSDEEETARWNVSQQSSGNASCSSLNGLFQAARDRRIGQRYVFRYGRSVARQVQNQD
jgi:hypothetical protein